MKNPALQDLRAALAVAQHRNFRAASSELALSPSALSHLIAQLEHRLKLRLFHRTTRSVSVTPAGERFLAKVRPSVLALQEAFLTAHDDTDGEPTGRLRINASSGGVRLGLLPVIAEYQRLYPRVVVEVMTEDRLIDLVEEGADLGVRTADLVPKDMVAVPFTSEIRLAVVGAASYFREHARPRTPADLGAHDCMRLRSARGVMHPWEFARKGKEFEVEVKGTLVLDDDDLKVSAARLGCGLAYVVERSVVDDLKSGALVQVLKEWMPTYPPLCLYYPGHRLVPATVRKFVDLAKRRR